MLAYVLLRVRKEYNFLAYFLFLHIFATSKGSQLKSVRMWRYGIYPVLVPNNGKEEGL